MQTIRTLKARKLALPLALAATLTLGFFVGRAQADQPRMHAALEHLRAAKAELLAADADKGGHRAKALKAVDQAIDQVQKGISFDRKH